MKHVRKMVLVDANAVKQTDNANTQQDGKYTDPLLNAINSLASATEFSRAYYGTNTTAISQLDKELKGILERIDIEPSLKLKLYSQCLKRYLFLQRMSEKSVPVTRPALVQSLDQVTPKLERSSVVTPKLEKEEDEEEEDGDTLHSSNRTDTSASFHTPVTNQRTSTSSHTPRGPKRRRQFQRSTPKSEILRGEHERTHNTKYDQFFDNWKDKKGGR